MEVKKTFKLVDDYKEEAFLNDLNKDGYLLESYNGEKYKLVKTDKEVCYLIEFFYKELDNTDLRKYKRLGYQHLYTFKSTVKGYYYYFISEEPVVDDHRQLKDRYENLLYSKTRVDRFTAIIFASTFVLFTYLFFKTMNQVYIFVLLLIVLLGGYFGHTYIETIKRLDVYAKLMLEKDGEKNVNDERRSRES